MFGLLTKLNKLKTKVQKWEKEKRIEENEELEKVDMELQSLTNVMDDFFFSVDNKYKI